MSQYASPYQALCELVNPLRIYGDVLNFEDSIRLEFIKKEIPWEDLRKILTECQRMAKVPNALPKIATGWVGRTNVTDRQKTTDGRAIAYIELKREITFAKYT